MALPACSDPETDVETTEPPLVEAVEARHGSLPIEEVVPGTVRARNQVMVRPEIEARVVEVLAQSGQAVERGQPLVRLDEAELRERLRQAEASVRLAEAAERAARARVVELEAQVVRSRKLAEENLVSAQDLEVLEARLDTLRAGAAEEAARVEQAEATAEERRSALDKTVVRSPVTGRIGERLVEEGMLVDTSTVLFVAGDLDELIVEITLSERMLGSVEIGQPVLIDSPSAGREAIRAEVSRISPFLSRGSFTTVGEIDLDNRGGLLRPGTFLDVRILVGESRSAVLVPTAALWEEASSGARGVFVVEEAAGLRAPAGGPEGAAGARESPGEPRAVSFRRVDVLAEGAGAVGVTGIEEGAWVVTVGQHLLAGAGPEGQASSARVRPVSWERVEALQALHNESLLEEFLAKQQTLAAALGAEIPESEDEVNRVLAEAAARDGRPGR
jgi:RND family efflux transporter MFP subunit